MTGPTRFSAAQVIARLEEVRSKQDRGWTDSEPGADVRNVETWRAEQWARAIPAAYVDARLSDLGASPAAEAISAWAVERGPRPNLVILGPVGVGKTYAAVAAVRPAHERGLDVAFYTAAGLLRDLSPGSPRQWEAWDAASDSARLILDDLGMQAATEWRDEQILELVDYRTRAQLPTIVTANLSIAGWAEAVGPRIVSRLAGSDAAVVTMTGADRRLA